MFLIELSLLLGLALGSMQLQYRLNDIASEPDTIPWLASAAWVTALVLAFGSRRRWPLLALALVTIGFCGMRLFGVPEYGASSIILFLAMEHAGHRGGRARTPVRAASLILIAISFLISWFTVDVPDEYRPLVGWSFGYELAFNIFFFGSAWLLGDSFRRRRARERELEIRTSQLEAERELNAERAVTDERLRIARELHDVVAHHVSVMGVQAGAARRLISRNPATAVDALATVEHSSRQAVRELQRLVGFLRSGEPEDLAPAPGLDRLEALLEDTRATTGLDVVGAVRGEPFPVPDSVGLSVYRIVQEALTNTIKHGHARRVELELCYDEPAIVVDVRDDGVGFGGPGSPNGSGHGLAGMRERVALHGGTLNAGADPAGGFRVTARFPAVNGAGS